MVRAFRTAAAEFTFDVLDGSLRMKTVRIDHKCLSLP